MLFDRITAVPAVSSITSEAEYVSPLTKYPISPSVNDDPLVKFRLQIASEKENKSLIRGLTKRRISEIHHT